jgi:hypothetical protein
MIKLACQDMNNLKYFDHWAYVARSFDVAKENLLATDPGGFPLVLVQPADGQYLQGEIPLPDFTHPEDCVYLFGSSDALLQELPRTPFAKVYIPSLPTWEMYSHQAGAIVLYDRFVKRGANG